MRRIIVFILLWVVLPLPTLAFSPHYLLSDSEFQDSTAWTLPEVRNFLETKGSPLSRYAPHDVDGTLKQAADIIVIAGRKHRVNPKVLLVLLQKEQSLVENGELGIKNKEVWIPKVQHRLNWATGYGVCDDCKKNDPRLQVFRGFAQQVDFAAERLRYFFDHPQEFRIRAGKVTTIDRQRITPLTQATAGLYLYTPHIAGNRSFWIIWNRWFAQLYPEGALLQNEKTKELWYIAKGRRRKITNSLLKSTLAARGVASVSPDELLKYREGKPMTGAPYAIVRSPDGVVWFLRETTRQRIANADVLKDIGFSPEEIDPIELATLAEYHEGAPIQDALAASAVRLVKGPNAPTVYLLEDGKKRAFISGQVFERLGYRWSDVITVGADILEHYRPGLPVDAATDTVEQALKEYQKP